MRTGSPTPLVLTTAILCTCLGFRSASLDAAEHRHGVADLEISLAGTRLTVRLAVPAADLRGYEHAPRDREDQAADAAARKTLQSIAQPLGLPAAAGCRIRDRQVRSPEDPADEGGLEPEHDHDHDHDTEHSAGAGHGDYVATWTIDCSAPATLAWVEPRLMASLPKVSALTLAILTPRGQARASATAPATRIALP